MSLHSDCAEAFKVPDSVMISQCGAETQLRNVLGLAELIPVVQKCFKFLFKFL